MHIQVLSNKRTVEKIKGTVTEIKEYIKGPRLITSLSDYVA